MELGERRWIDHVPGRTGKWPVWLVLAAGVGFVVGVGTAALTPAYAIALVVGLLAAALLANTQVGLLGVVAVTALLPFGVVPLALGPFKLTFLDFILVALLLVWMGRLLTNPLERLRMGSLGGLILAFIVLALVSFAAGTAYAISADSTRLFLKIVNSILLYFTVVNCIRTRRQLRQVIAAIILAGAAAAVVGLLLYYLPVATSTKLLTSLRPFGYPTEDVLRYIASTSVQRAIGTAIDPNILGAWLMLASTIGIAQALARRPVLDRRIIVVLLLPLLACLLLTYSRSSWMGLAIATLLIATLRYRRLWLVFVLLAVALYFGILPSGEGFIGHLQSGLTAQDQAAAMRLGEYSDAFKLIGQYPWFGVGFGAAPTIDLYVGVSSIYLLMAENMGLIGVAAFLIIVLRLGWQTASTLPRIDDEGLHGMVLATGAALIAALVAGVFDHHFFNLRFPHTVALFWLLVGLTVAGVGLGVERKVSA